MMVFSSSKYDSILPFLHRLHWPQAPERIQYKLVVLTFKCLHGTAPPHLADEFLRYSDLEARGRLRLASSSSLIIRRLSGPSSSGHCYSSLKRTTATRHVCTVPASFLQLSEDSFSAFPLPTCCSARELTFVVIGHFNLFCSLRTY